MIHAVIHNKKTHNTKKAWELEDNITSSFFGSLCYMNTEESSVILRKMFDFDEKPDVMRFEFWPRYQSREPDLMIFMSSANNPIKTLLIEVKWEASQSGSNGEHQLKQQFDAYMNYYTKKYGELKWKEEKGRLIIIYLVLYGNKAKEEITEDNRPNHEYSIMTWNEIIRSIQRLNCTKSEPMRLWQNDMVSYLSTLLANIFHGFTPDITKGFQKKSVNPLFFTPFQGFSKLRCNKVLDNSRKLFFGE